MDFLNQFAKQISDLFRSMTPGSRIAVGLLLAVLGVSLFFLFAGKVTQSGEYLFGGTSFDQAQANKMLAAFGVEGLSKATAVPTSDGFKIKVKGDNASYVAALAKNDSLPPDCYDWVREALNDTSITQSPREFQELIQNAKSNELKKIIRSMKNIDWAQVMYYRGKPQGFTRTEKSSATIVVKPAQGEIITAKLARALQQTASGSLGILAADITVTDAQTGHCFSGNLNSGEVADNHRKNDYEADWQQKIRDLLNIPGMTVAVNVELDPYKNREELIIKPNKKDVIAAQSYQKSSKIDKKEPGPAGRPGLTANMPNRIAQTGTTMSTDSQKNSESINNNLIGGNEERRIYARRPERVNVSIRLPSDYFLNIWKSRNPTPEGEEAKTPTAAELATIATEEVDKTKQSVANLLSDDKNAADASKFVNVTTYESLVVPPIQEAGMMTKATAWLSKYWTVLGLFALAFLSLRVLRSVMRGVPIEIGETGGSKGKEAKGGLEAGISEEESKEIASEMLRRFEGSPHSLRDELSNLVKQDTDTAATILRSWIGTPMKS